MSNICETCNKTFTLKSNLKNHITIDHLKLNPFWCNVCEKSFSTTTALEQHVNTVHKKLKSFQCEICSTSFTHNQSLKNHINCVHLKLQPYNCDYCDTSFGNKSNLRNHIDAVHLDYKPFGCNQCGMFFAQNSTLKKHISSIHDRISKNKTSGVTGVNYVEINDKQGSWVVNWIDKDKKRHNKSFIRNESWGPADVYSKEGSKNLAIEYKKAREAEEHINLEL
jgi:uncharacterized Zn-finger protein